MGRGGIGRDLNLSISRDLGSDGGRRAPGAGNAHCKVGGHAKREKPRTRAARGASLGADPPGHDPGLDRARRVHAERGPGVLRPVLARTRSRRFQFRGGPASSRPRAVRHQIVGQFELLMGPAPATAVNAMLERAAFGMTGDPGPRHRHRDVRRRHDVRFRPAPGLAQPDVGRRAEAGTADPTSSSGSG